ncbi:actin cytoskeleton organization protein App1 [Cladophialophora carrionii]|uniref:Actin cytoskeleton organization protein App1 n=1 Tax=Cladophialophora carrionii TaxID=86049 RepID=A0A1C1C7K3_9EURO|nr:actin cytoskeleton organization protein App1 [Cladophialophora carrionii]
MTSYGGGRLPGARRERVKGYLRAANELRQTYQAQIQQKLQDNVGDGGVPGDWPDAEIVRSGNEEMLLFPSYARKHTRRKTRPDEEARYQPGTHESLETPHSSGDADYWKREWEKYEDANAIVDVDVRGWIYCPQSGPLNRKNRLLVAVARRLSGIYAPTPSPAASRSSSLAPNDRAGSDDSPSRREDELAAREAENIARRGQREADAAVRGSYSSSVSRGGTPAGSRSSSPTRSVTIPADTDDDDPGHQSVIKRQSWNEPANMSREQLAAANELLLTRLGPFMSMPTAHVPITVFFYNKEKSTSKSVTTDDSGHFNLRAALDFIPDQVRVLASEKLSAVEDVIITDHDGVSLISDIDDTIKHSAIGNGAREIFKNTFIRELSDLTIKGVKEWYTKLANMGVKLHYVSNSPWQLYPLLRSYFSLAGLPPGSFHLKQYSGMLQGIFEPAAERKRGSLDRIMNDFPERKFILVGDSGEADLEVYTDVVLEHPGRILGVFIRDVTTPVQKGFFDQAISNTPPDSMITREGRLSRSPGDAHADDPASRPALPTRPKSIADPRSAEGDLIDFTDDPVAKSTSPKPSTYSDDLQKLETNGKSNGPPAKPKKPSSLRNFSTQLPTPPANNERLSASSDTEAQEAVKKKTPPPPPPAPRRSGRTPESMGPDNAESTPPPPSRPPFSSARQNQAPPPPLSRTATSGSTSSSHNDEGYVASARRQISSAYNALPAIRSQSPSGTFTSSSDSSSLSSDHRPNPPLPMRRNLTSYPAAAARWATGADTYSLPGGGTGQLGAPSAATEGAPYDKKIEIWRRRWARAEEIMRARKVVLRSWRVGGDVSDECIRLVKRELERQERERHRS